MMRPGTTMISRAGEGIAQSRCGCCGDELTAHQAVASGICDKPRCQDWKIEQAGLALLQRRREQAAQRASAATSTGTETGTGTGTAPDARPAPDGE